jgi:hypothetical protein
MQKTPDFLYEDKPNLRIKIPVEKDETLEKKLSPIMALLSYLNCFLYKEQTEYND